MGLVVKYNNNNDKQSFLCHTFHTSEPRVRAQRHLSSYKYTSLSWSDISSIALYILI